MNCEACSNYIQCKNSQIPLEVIARAVELIYNNTVDEVIEGTLKEEFGVILQEYGTTMKLFRKYFLEFEETCSINKNM